MTRTLVALLLAAALSGCGSSTSDPAVEASTGPTAGPPPASMAALGDSITQAFTTCGGLIDCPGNSWATGDNPAVDSHADRIADASGERPETANLAVSGAKVAALPEQAAEAVLTGADYVTVLIGANDVCRPTEAEMTPVSEFEASVAASFDALSSGLPQARLFVASVPDVYTLWEVGRSSPAARGVWALGICQSMLADPVSDDPADEQRRQRVRDRVIAYNDVLERACTEYGPNCRWDGGAVFEDAYTQADLSFDWFHPSIQGQQRLAEGTYEAGFNW